MQRMAGSSSVEGFLIDWGQSPSLPRWRLPAFAMDDAQVAAELGRLQRDRAQDTAREAELILRLAQLRPDTDDPPPGARGGRRRGWRRTDPELSGVSEFFADELGHVINLGRGTAAFRARRALTWQENLPATFAALHRGRLDERRAGVLADLLQHIRPELSRAVEARVLPEAEDLSLAELRRRALAALAELDASAIQQRHEEATRGADVRAYDTGDGMATLAGDMTAEQAAACHAVIDALAAMAKADGDPRPIGQIRAAIMAMLILRPADHGQPAVSVQLTVTATAETLEGTSTRPGEVNGFTLTTAQLRDLLRRVGALGLTAPDGGTLTLALTDQHGRLLATTTPAELARRAAQGCPDHPDPPPNQRNRSSPRPSRRNQNGHGKSPLTTGSSTPGSNRPRPSNRNRDTRGPTPSSQARRTPRHTDHTGRTPAAAARCWAHRRRPAATRPPPPSGASAPPGTGGAGCPTAGNASAGPTWTT